MGKVECITGCLKMLKPEGTLRRKRKKSSNKNVLNFPDPCKPKEKQARQLKKTYQLQEASTKD